MTARETAAAATAPSVRWAAPGRVNLIGEHTDYNDGYVLPVALPHLIVATARARTDDVIGLRSIQRPGEHVAITLADLRPRAVNGWAAYAAGVVWSLREDGAAIGGFDLVVDGNVPLGAGLSSSAALECAVAAAVNDLFGLGLPPVELALAAQRAENDFVGVPVGIMDQLAAMLCTAGHALFLDTRTLATEHVRLDLAAAGLALLVIDTAAPHRLVDGEYAARRRTCEYAAAELGVRALRDIPADALPEALGRLDDPVSRKRVRHVVTENDRVLDAVALLKAGELRKLGSLLTASHESLRDDYEVSSAELDAAVAAALAAGALGARMTGGGFGGCAIALVEATGAGQVEATVERAFAVAGFRPPRVFSVEPSAGAHPVFPARVP